MGLFGRKEKDDNGILNSLEAYCARPSDCSRPDRTLVENGLGVILKNQGFTKEQRQKLITLQTALVGAEQKGVITDLLSAASEFNCLFEQRDLTVRLAPYALAEHIMAFRNPGARFTELVTLIGSTADLLCCRYDDIPTTLSSSDLVQIARASESSGEFTDAIFSFASKDSLTYSLIETKQSYFRAVQRQGLCYYDLYACQRNPVVQSLFSLAPNGELWTSLTTLEQSYAVNEGKDLLYRPTVHFIGNDDIKKRFDDLKIRYLGSNQERWNVECNAAYLNFLVQGLVAISKVSNGDCHASSKVISSLLASSQERIDTVATRLIECPELF